MTLNLLLSIYSMKFKNTEVFTIVISNKKSVNHELLVNSISSSKNKLII